MKRLFAMIIVLAVGIGPLFPQKKDTYRVRTVVIDPGHGGAKPGAQGARSWEKNITLDVAKKFGKLIEDNYPDVKVVYTRTTDADISLAERANIANRNKADLFISIHANSHPTTAPTGVETFVMGLSESKANLEVAKKENADILLEADYKSNADYKDFDPNSPESWVVLTLFQNSYIEKSLNFAAAIQNQYRANLKTINRGVKQAELFVLYKTAMPSVLTEIGFISNPTEEAFMLSDEGQAKIAICLFNAFMTYKATEEGTDKPSAVVYNIAGYKSAEAEKDDTPKAEAEPKAEPVAEALATPAPEPVVEPKAEAVAAPVVEPKAEAVAEPQVETVAEPKVEPKIEPKAEPVAKPVAEPKDEQTVRVSANTKPTPTVELPKQEPQPAPAPQPKPEATAQPAAEPQQAPATKPVREALQAPNNTAPADAKQYYTVQFLTLNTTLAPGAPELEGITDFRTIRQGRGIAYTTGRFKTQAEAAAYCNHLKRATSFADAWAYLYKVPSSQQQQAAPAATATTDNTAASATPSAKGITYRIQFCSARKQMKAGDPDLHGISDFRFTQSGKLYIYTTGNYNNVADAKRRLAEIQRTTPFKDAFIFGLYKGQRISLEQAAEIEKR